MAENKKSFVLYGNIAHTVKKLSKDQIADLFLTILDYVNDENPVITDFAVDLVFEPIKQQLKIDLKKWDEKVSKYSAAGREGGVKSGEARRKNNEAKRSDASIASTTERIEAVNDNVIVNVNVNDIKKEDFSFLWTEIVKSFHADFRWKEKFCIDKVIKMPMLEIRMNEFINDLELKEDYKDLKDLKHHFTNWFNKVKTMPPKQPINSGPENRKLDTTKYDAPYVTFDIKNYDRT